MYTQCPDCSTAFRVTATVLKQAAGKVRCGGCGNAFNALEFLSETMPAQAASAEPESPVPEIAAESQQSGDGSPNSISAEQTAALMKTLDELEGPDIRIEDTGVEWRVLDEEEMSEMAVDELLDESPTPIDQFLTKTPSAVEAGEIFDESANAFARTPVEELRFDDNTPLPDDFDLDDESSYLPESPEQDASVTEADAEARLFDESEDTEVDIDLGEPEEWADILDEFDQLSVPETAPLDTGPAAADDPDELLDVDTQFALQAEAMGIDLSGIHQSPEHESNDAASRFIDDEQALATEPDAAHNEGVEIELIEEPVEEEPVEESEPEFSTPPSEEAEPELADAAGENLEPELDMEAEVEDTGNQLVDQEENVDNEEAEQELADAAGENLERELDMEADDEATGQRLVDQEDNDDSEEAEPELADAAGEDAKAEIDAETDATGRRPIDEEQDEAVTPLEFGTMSDAMAELEEQSNVFDNDFFDTEEGLDLEVEDEIGIADEPDVAVARESDFVIPPQSEEEQTLNLMIDEDLLSLAIEDEDGFASTIVVAEEEADTMDTGERERLAMEPNISTDFESIVLEGEFVHSALDMEKREADIAAGAELAEQAKAARDAENATSAGGRRRGMAAAIVALTLLIVAQVMHQSREALATIPAINSVLAPVYQAIGKPVAPAWDVTGWAFEATQPRPDDNSERFTVLSRIGNRSDNPLPHPLINVALIDRFEETIGSHTFEPADYLTNDLDPDVLVQPGSTFTAVISIPSPEENATGYKLKVCYRLSAGRLRCSSPDFK